MIKGKNLFKEWFPPMNTRKFAPNFVFAALLVLLTFPLGWGQANVDESQETAKIYVDAVNGNDTNPGTQAQPLKTIGAGVSMAVKNNQQNIGSKVIINPGTYREAVQFYGTQKDTSKPITLAAAVAGTAVMSGADVWPGWQAYSKNADIFTHNWPYQWGLCPTDPWDDPSAEQDIVRRREIIAVNGAPLTQVLAFTAMRVGTFFVDETHATVYIWPANGTKINSATVEVATRDLLLNIGRRNNLVLRGLTFQYSNACRGDPALEIHNSDNVLIGKNYFFWNNSTGLKLFDTTHFTVRHTVAEFNGTSGTKGQKTKYDLWHDILSQYNGWRGAQGIYYKWGEAAVHFGLAHDQTLSKIQSSWNQTHGLHWDTDNANVVADSLLLSQNLLDGGVIEKTEGPLTISNTYFCNGNPIAGPNSDGVTLRNSKNVTLTGDAMLNAKNQVVITGIEDGIPVENWETHEHYNLITENLTFNNNVAQAGPGSKIFMDPTLGDDSWKKFQKTLASDYNVFWNSDNTMVFTVPTPEDWSKLDFPGWQQTAKADTHSTWKSPGHRESHCEVTPDKSDFWFIMDFQSGYQTVQAGSPAVFPAQVTALSFTGTVLLSADGVQNIPGGKGTWDANQIINSGTANYTVTTSPSTPKGNYNVTLLATSGSVTKTMFVTVIVN